MTTTDAVRSEMIAAAASYVDALVSHDSASARLADDVRRLGNGRVVLEGADALRAVIEREPVAAIDRVAWIVEPPHVAVVYDLEADMTRAQQSETFGPRESWIPAYIAERFTVVDGLITEIEVVYAASEQGRPRPPRPDRYPRDARADAPARATVVDAARAYLAALVSHDGSEVPLAPQAWRVENGHGSGDSGPEIASALAAEIMHVVAGVRDELWIVEDDTAVVFYTLDVDLGRLPNAAPDAPKSAKRLGERFRVVEGMVAEIEAVIPAEDIAPV
jgi:hypothetical protein